MTLDKVDTLKLDKDCNVARSWLKGYIKTIIQICLIHGIEVISIDKGQSKCKGFHLYIKIYPAIEASHANYLQWILGDDCQRVDFNRARINVGFNDWNKIFPPLGRRIRTIYHSSKSCVFNLQQPLTRKTSFEHLDN